MIMTASRHTLALLLAGLAVACSKTEAHEAVVSSAVPQESRDVFTQRCATCHGMDGRGTGPAAVALNPKPRNYGDKAWQGTVTDDQIKSTIVGGGPAVGKSALMPPNPDLAGKPEVVAGLVSIVRSFGR